MILTFATEQEYADFKSSGVEHRLERGPDYLKVFTEGDIAVWEATVPNSLPAEE